jgi:hypothetical protein
MIREPQGQNTHACLCAADRHISHSYHSSEPFPTPPADTCRKGVPFSYAAGGSTYAKSGGRLCTLRLHGVP